MADESPEQTATATPADVADVVEDAAGAAAGVSEAELPQACPGIVPGAPGQIEILLDAQMGVMVELGRAEVLVRDLLALGAGSVIKLDRRKGEPVDLYLRGVKFATGNLVVVGDHLGVRVREILSPPKPGAPG